MEAHKSGAVVLGRWDFWNCGQSDCGLHWFTYLFCSLFTLSLSVWGVLYALVWLRRPLYSLSWDPSWTQYDFPFKQSSLVITIITFQLRRLWFPWVHELVTLCRWALCLTLYGSCDLSESSEAEVLAKLIVTLLIKKFSPGMEPGVFLAYSQDSFGSSN
jgi:hypothetical protein